LEIDAEIPNSFDAFSGTTKKGKLDVVFSVTPAKAGVKFFLSK
jgi:hypothetical protein